MEDWSDWIPRVLLLSIVSILDGMGIRPVILLLSVRPNVLIPVVIKERPLIGCCIRSYGRIDEASVKVLGETTSQY